MANVQTRHGPLPHDVPLTANTHWDTDTLSVPWPPRAPPSPRQRPVSVQPYIRAVGPHDAVFQPMYDAAGNRRPDGHWVDIPPPNENIAARWPPQDLQYGDMEDLGMAHYPPPPPLLPAADHVGPHDWNDRGMNYNARVAQGVPAPVQVIAPPAPDELADLAPAFLVERPHQVPIFVGPAREILRRMADRYLNDPDSQVNMIRMEPGTAGGIRVDITLELANLF